MLAPDLCKNCPNHCCTRPSLTTEEYVRMSRVVGNDILLRFEPRWEPRAGAWLFKSECPAASDTGCVMPYEERPLMCRIFPWVAIPVYQDDYSVQPKLFLAAARCPQWKAFGDNYDVIRQEFENGCEES